MFEYGKKPTIAIQNRCRAGVELGCDLGKTVDALQTQLDRDFFPAWGRSANLVLLESESRFPRGVWQLLIVESADDPGAEGYHELTEDGLPIMYVGVKDTLSAGDKVSVTVGHEVLEGIIDPAINVSVENALGHTYGVEVCDAVECDEYLIGGVPMTNFQTPDWFIEIPADLHGGARFDHLALCKKPFEIRDGGYMPVKLHGRWTQQLAPRQRRFKYSRRQAMRVMGGKHAAHAAAIAGKAA